METGAAGDDRHRLHLVEHFAGSGAKDRVGNPVALEPAFQRLGDRAGLRENLLQHEMAITGLFGRVRRQLGDRFRTRHAPPFDVVDRDAAAGDFRDIAVFEEDESLGDGQQREDVRCNEVLADPEADDERAAATGSDQALGRGARHHPEGEGAHEFAGGRLDRQQEIKSLL